MMRTVMLLAVGILVTVRAVGLLAEDSRTSAPADPLVQAMAGELEYSMGQLTTEDGTKPYFLSYSVADITSVTLRASLGAVYGDSETRGRLLDVDLRVGDYSLDNTHQIRGGNDFARMGRVGGSTAAVPLDNDPVAIQHVLWQSTDRAFKSAVERYQRVTTDVKTTVAEESKAHDFSREEPSIHADPDASLGLDRTDWANRLRQVSRLALKYPLIYDSTVAIAGSAENRYFVSSEGSRLKTGTKRLRVYVSASTKADDGMDLSHSFIFNCASESGLPSDQQMQEAFRRVIEMVLALRAAPVVEPYTGPAILLNRASGVFFHEIFGHCIEGHRQKNVEEGQTFTPCAPETRFVANGECQEIAIPH